MQVWHMVEVTRRDFNEHHITQVPMTDNQPRQPSVMEVRPALRSIENLQNFENWLFSCVF